MEQALERGATLEMEIGDIPHGDRSVKQFQLFCSDKRLQS
jgi:hypothetical protein